MSSEEKGGNSDKRRKAGVLARHVRAICSHTGQSGGGEEEDTKMSVSGSSLVCKISAMPTKRGDADAIDSCRPICSRCSLPCRNRIS
jgi:hypothetical protein